MGGESKEMMGWDDEITDDGKKFEPLPEGDYNFTVEKYERTRTSGEGKLGVCNMAVVYFDVEGPDGRIVSIRENYVLHDDLKWKLVELFCSVGLMKKGQTLKMNWGMLPGKKGRAKIKQVPGTKDPSKTYNKIDELYPKEGPNFTPGAF